MVASYHIGVCEALVYGHKAGLKLELMISLLNKGAAGSFMLERLCPLCLKRDFDPHPEHGLCVDQFVKDLGIALEEARSMNISLTGTSLAT